jgi:iron-sulfur cluster repair protein YtfE (RIC family)
MSTTTHRSSPRPDTEEMVIVHNCFRRQFATLPGLIRAVPAGDGGRAAVLTGFLAELLDGLHHHHTTEDDYLWPLLLQRVDTDADLVRRMEQQHDRVDALMQGVRALNLRFAETAGVRDGTELAGRLEQLTAALTEHLVDEEQHILPLCQQVLSVPEWNELGERARAGIAKDKLLVQLGWLLDAADLRQRRKFLGELPLLVRVMWRLIGRRRWAAEYRRIYLSDPA